MNSSKSKEKRYIPVHRVRESLEPCVVLNILGFHALAGLDSTSHFYGNDKKTSCSTFLKYLKLLDSLGPIHPADKSDIEIIVIKMYSQKSTTTSIDNLRVEFFHRTNDPKKLPPTHDSSTLYVMRSNYQAMVWIIASVTCPTLLLPKESGWKLEGDMLQPRLMTLDPIPFVCTELLACACKTRCSLHIQIT